MSFHRVMLCLGRKQSRACANDNLDPSGVSLNYFFACDKTITMVAVGSHVRAGNGHYWGGVFSIDRAVAFLCDPSKLMPPLL